MGVEKALVIELFKSVTGVARELGISSQAISQWPDPIPEKQELKLRLRYPNIDRRLAHIRRRLSQAAKRGHAGNGSS